MGLRFAELERKFGEIDRARSIYTHICQFSDPRYDDQDLWKVKISSYYMKDLGKLRVTSWK